MRLNVSDLKFGFKNKNFKIFTKDLPDRGTKYKNNIVYAKLSLLKKKELFYLKGNLKAELEHICVRCLKRFPHKIDHPINIIILEKSMKNTIKTNFDILHFDRSRTYINPKNIFADLIALSEPFKPLCDQECTGLCSQCGVEKTTNCSCSEKENNPVWDKLKEKQF